MSFFHWQIHEGERRKSQAKQRAADVRMGQTAADLARTREALPHHQRRLWGALRPALSVAWSQRRARPAPAGTKMASSLRLKRSSK